MQFADKQKHSSPGLAVGCMCAKHKLQLLLTCCCSLQAGWAQYLFLLYICAMWLCGVHYLCSIYHISYNLSEFIKPILELEFRVASSLLSLFIKFCSSSLFFWFLIFNFQIWDSNFHVSLSISQISTNLVTLCWSNSVCQPAIFCWLGSWWKSEATLNSKLAHCHEIALLAAASYMTCWSLMLLLERKCTYIYIYMFNFNSQSTTPQGESLKLVSCIILIYMDGIHLYCYYCISPFNK